MRETNDTSSVQISEEEGRENLSINKSGSQEREKASRSKERDKEMSAEKVNVADGGAGNQGSDRKQEPTEQDSDSAADNSKPFQCEFIDQLDCCGEFPDDNMFPATVWEDFGYLWKEGGIDGRNRDIRDWIADFGTCAVNSNVNFLAGFHWGWRSGDVCDGADYYFGDGIDPGAWAVYGVDWSGCWIGQCCWAFDRGYFYRQMHTAKPKGLPVRLKIKRIDFQGAISLVSGLTMILLALNFGGNGSKWTGATVLCLLIFGFVMLGVFVFIELRVAKEPILPLHLFSIRNVWSIVSAQFFIGFSLYGLIYFIPLYDTIVNNASASKAGLFLLPFILSLVSFSICTGVAITKTGRYRIFFRSGAVSLAVGAGLLITLNEDTSSGLVKLFLVFCGAGCGMTMQSLIVCIQAAVPRRVIAGATSTVMFSRMLSGTVGNVMASVVYKSVVNSNASHLMQEYPASAEKIKAALDDTRLMHNLSLDPVISASLIDAYIKGLRDVFTMFCVVTSIGFLFTMATIHVPLSSPPPPPPPPQPEPNPT